MSETTWLTIVRDLTERKQAEKRLREYERVVEGLEEMIVVVDRDYRYVIANRAALNYRGLEKNNSSGAPSESNWPRRDIVNRPSDWSSRRWMNAFRGKVVQYEFEVPRIRKLGRENILLSYFPIEGTAGVDRIACVCARYHGAQASGG